MQYLSSASFQIQESLIQRSFWILALVTILIQTTSNCVCTAGATTAVRKSDMYAWPHCTGCDPPCAALSYGSIDLNPTGAYFEVKSCVECASERGSFVTSPTSCANCAQLYNQGCISCTPTACTACEGTKMLVSGKCHTCGTLYSQACLTCDSTTCQSCASGYYVATTCLACSSQYGSGCLTCDNVACFNCSPGSGLSGGSCVPCTTLIGPGCSDCSGSSCLTCSGALILRGNVCDTCPAFYGAECTACNGNTCQNCLTGTALVTPNCVACNTLYGTPCTACNSSSCMVCTTGTGLRPPRCEDCNVLYKAPCTTCDSNTCLVCSAGSALRTPNCQLCPVLYGAPCTSCDSNTCIICSAGSALKTPNCTLCTILYGTPCTSCDSTTCLNCSPGSALITPNCISCPKLYKTGCTSCNNAKCLICSAGYILTDPDCTSFDQLFGLQCTFYDAIQCFSCTTGYVRNTSLARKPCVACSDINGCAKCMDGPICTDCQSGYFLNNTISPSPLCFLCGNFSNCASCATNQMTCLTCKSGFYHEYTRPGQQCVPCDILNCLTCAHGLVCTSCEPNYILNVANQNKSCLMCLWDEFSFNNSCVKCSGVDNQCITCNPMNNSINCTLCQVKWIPNPPDWLCEKCYNVIPHCLQCSDLQNCTLCKYPYILGNTSKCDQCEDGFEWLDGFCIKQIGCISALPDYSKCLGCFVSRYFFYDPLTSICLCNKGYNIKKVNRASICVGQCGNQIQTQPNEQCDDGNLRDGDGCDKNCKLQPNFACSSAQPNQCSLYHNVTELKYNYAQRIEGQNKCKFSFSVFPMHAIFALVDWSKYLNLNISSDLIIPESIFYEYLPNTNQITVQMKYHEHLENIIVKATLGFSQNTPVQLVQTSFKNDKKISAGPVISSYPKPLIVSIPSELSLEIKIKGRNSIILFQDEGILSAYRVSLIGFMIISALALLFFLISSYFHKMIGLQTIQILQFHYFMTMIVEQKKTVFLKSLNILKYTAFGGYSNYQYFYDISDQTLSLASVQMPENFLFVGLNRYFSLNVNLPLIFPILFLLIYSFWIMIKAKKRSDYLKSRHQYDKDLYTSRRRSAQWVYDHLVFPFVNIFSMIVFFCTILQLKSTSSFESSSDASDLEFVERTSFIPNTIAVLVTFSMIAYEVFVSYEQYKHSILTEQEKARTPSSLVEKLEHDENNPDRENYKPGYVLVYLLYYFVVQMILTINVLIKEISQYGMDLMLVVTFVYFIIVWNWNPYSKEINFHNKALKLNHFTAFYFVFACQLFTRVELSPSFFTVLIYLSLVLMLMLSICAFARLYAEYQFRKLLEEKPTLMEEKKKTVENETESNPLKLSKRDRLLLHNKYTIENQIEGMFKEAGKNPFEPYPKKEEDRIELMKQKIREELKSTRKSHLQITVNKLENRKLLNDRTAVNGAMKISGLSQKLKENDTKKDRALKNYKQTF